MPEKILKKKITIAAGCYLFIYTTYLYFDRNSNNFLKNKLIFTGILQAYLQKPIQNLIKIVPVPNLQNQTAAVEVQWF